MFLFYVTNKYYQYYQYSGKEQLGFYPFRGLGDKTSFGSEPIIISKVIKFSFSSSSPSLIGWAGQVLKGNYSRGRLTKIEKNHMMSGSFLKKATNKILF